MFKMCWCVMFLVVRGSCIVFVKDVLRASISMSSISGVNFTSRSLDVGLV